MERGIGACSRVYGSSRFGIREPYAAHTVALEGLKHLITKVRTAHPPSMDLLDEDGRILGLVNVVDALVVVVVLAVAVAGAALVLQSEPEAEPTLGTTHATLDLGPQPDYLAVAIMEGDTYEPSSSTSLTITDVHLMPADGGTRVLARVRLEGPRTGDSIRYEGAPPRLGRKLEVATDTYQVSGRIRAVGESNALSTGNTSLLLKDTLPATEARAVAPGDEMRVAGRTVGTIEDVAVYSTADPAERAVFVHATVQAVERGSVPRFGDTQLRRGQTLALPFDEYTIRGRIEHVGTSLERGNEAVLIRDTVDSATAERIAVGDTSTVAGRPVGSVESVSVYGTPNPDQKRVFVGLDLRTLEYRLQPHFGQTPVQTGREITFHTDEYSLTGPLVRVGAATQRGHPAHRTVTIRMDGVSREMARAIRAGLVERANGDTIAAVTNVSISPEKILIRGDDGSLGVYDHPTERQVTITASLSVRETTDGVRFKGESIRQGSQITLDLETITVRGRIVSIQ